jgi:hypothetical protein
MTKLLSKFTVGDTIVRFDAPADPTHARTPQMNPPGLSRQRRLRAACWISDGHAQIVKKICASRQGVLGQFR